MAFLFGTLPGMENFQFRFNSESDSPSDAETTTLGSNAETTTIGSNAETTTLDSNVETITLDSNTKTPTIDSNSETATADTKLGEHTVHTPLTPESLDDLSQTSNAGPDEPIVVLSSGSNSPVHLSPPSPSSYEQSETSQTTSSLAPDNISMSKPKNTKKPASSPPQSSPNIAHSKPKITKKVGSSINNTSLNKKLISKEESAKQDGQLKPSKVTPTNPRQGKKVVSDKNIKTNENKGLEKSTKITAAAIRKKPAISSDLIKSPNLLRNKKVLSSASQSEITSTNSSTNPRSRKRPSSQQSTKAEIKIPKLNGIFKDIVKHPMSTENPKQTKKTSELNSGKATLKSAVASNKSALSSKTTQKESLRSTSVVPIKPILQQKTNKIVPIKPKLQKKSSSENPAIKNSKISKSFVKIKLDEESLTNKTCASIGPPTPKGRPQHSSSVEGPKPSTSGLRSTSGRRPKPSLVGPPKPSTSAVPNKPTPAGPNKPSRRLIVPSSSVKQPKPSTSVGLPKPKGKTPKAPKRSSGGTLVSKKKKNFSERPKEPTK